MAMYFTTENFRKLVPRLSETRSMAALAVNLGACACMVSTPLGSFLASIMTWNQYAVVFSMWGAATIPIQRYFARGYQGIYIENQLRYQLGHHLAGQTVVVTGASSGIGYELALRLAQNGCENVIMACKDRAETEAAIKAAPAHIKSIRNQLGHWPSEPHYRQWESKHSDRLKFMELDLADEDSISKFVKELTWQHPKIDMLINNAGIISDEKSRMTKSGHEYQLATNALGPFMLTEMLLPLVDRRIVYVASSSHKLPSKDAEFDIVGVLDTLQYDAVAQNPVEQPAVPPQLTEEEEFAAHLKKEREIAVRYRIQARGQTLEEAKAYAASNTSYDGPSKLINIMHVRDLRDRLHGRGLISVAVHPGRVTTGFMRSFPTAQWISNVVGPFFYKSPIQGARAVLQCCVADDVKNGAYYADGWVAESHATPLSASHSQKRSVMEWCSEQWDFKVPVKGTSVK